MEAGYHGFWMFSFLALFNPSLPLGGLVELQFEIRVYIRVFCSDKIAFLMVVPRAATSIALLDLFGFLLFLEIRHARSLGLFLHVIVRSRNQPLF